MSSLTTPVMEAQMSAHDPFAPSSGVKPPSDGPKESKESSAPAKSPEGTEAPAATPEAPAAEQTTPEPAPVEGAPEETNASDDSTSPDGALEVPKGTSKEVLEWVGDDKDRAKAALEAEQASGEPRKGLTHDLEELVG